MNTPSAPNSRSSPVFVSTNVTLPTLPSFSFTSLTVVFQIKSTFRCQMHAAVEFSAREAHRVGE